MIKPSTVSVLNLRQISQTQSQAFKIHYKGGFSDFYFVYDTHRYESTVFLGMYIIYVLIMYFNPRLGKFFMGRVDEWRKSGEVTDGAVKEGNGKVLHGEGG